MAGTIAITRREMTAAELRAASAKAKWRGRRGGCWRSRWCWRGSIARPRRRPAAWTARRCATGCTATTPRGWRGCRTAAAGPAAAALGGAEGAAGGAGRGGSRPEVDRVVRWRRIDLQRWIEAEFGVVLHERTVGKLLRSSAIAGCRCVRTTRRPTRPPRRLLKKLPAGGSRGHPRGSARQAARDLVPGRGPRRPAGHADPGLGEARHPAARRRDRRYEWAYLFGAVCPERGTGAALVLPYANTEAMNLHLAEIARTVAPGAHAVLLLDGAGWHGGKELAVPDNISLLPLPPYAPELNPVGERLGVPARQRALQYRLRQLRRHRRRLLRRLELLHR